MPLILHQPLPIRNGGGEPPLTIQPFNHSTINCSFPNRLKKAQKHEISQARRNLEPAPSVYNHIRAGVSAGLSAIYVSLVQ
jgi:hypothetical protein